MFKPIIARQCSVIMFKPKIDSSNGVFLKSWFLNQHKHMVIKHQFKLFVSFFQDILSVTVILSRCFLLSQFNFILELVCCIVCLSNNSSWPVTGLGNKGPLKVLNGTKLILDDHGNMLDSSRINWEFFRFFIGPLLPKPGQKQFFVVF